MKLLLERELLRILGKKDEPGRPLLYGTTTQFLEFFGLKSLKDLPTLREFAELSDESRRVAEAELGDVLLDAVSAAPAARNVDTSATDSMTKEPPVEPGAGCSAAARDTEVDAMPAVDGETTITDPGARPRGERDRRGRTERTRFRIAVSTSDSRVGRRSEWHRLPCSPSAPGCRFACFRSTKVGATFA